MAGAAVYLMYFYRNENKKKSLFVLQGPSQSYNLGDEAGAEYLAILCT